MVDAKIGVQWTLCSWYACDGDWRLIWLHGMAAALLEFNTKISRVFSVTFEFGCYEHKCPCIVSKVWTTFVQCSCECLVVVSALFANDTGSYRCGSRYCLLRKLFSLNLWWSSNLRCTAYRFKMNRDGCRHPLSPKIVRWTIVCIMPEHMHECELDNIVWLRKWHGETFQVIHRLTRAHEQYVQRNFVVWTFYHEKLVSIRGIRKHM